MLKVFKRIWNNEKSRQKLMITAGILLLVRLGNQIPTYGVNTDYFAETFSQNGAFNFFNSLSGNSFSKLSLFTLSITPYITASIIMQLLTVAIPRLESMVKNEIDGKERLEKITYVAAGVLGYLEALAMAIGFGKSGLLKSYTWYHCLIVTLLWGTSALLVIFLGKLIDKKGIGNGISLILLFNILSSLPSDAVILYERFCSGKGIFIILFRLCIILIITLAVFLFALILTSAEKKIKIQYSKGHLYVGAPTNYLPIKLCIAGVMPVIFASSLMAFPSVVSSFVSTDGFLEKVFHFLNSGNWFLPSKPIYTLGYLVYVFLVLFFGYFYTSISFNTQEIADNLRRSGGTIAGIRPGKQTVDYLNKEIKYLIFLGTFGLLIVATIPMVISGCFGISSLSFGGTSIMIIANVLLETKKQLEIEAMYHHSYKAGGF